MSEPTHPEILNGIIDAIEWLAEIDVLLSDLKSFSANQSGRVDIQVGTDFPGGQALDDDLHERFHDGTPEVARYVLGNGAVSFGGSVRSPPALIPGTMIHQVIIHDSAHARHEAREKRLARLRKDAEALGVTITEEE